MVAPVPELWRFLADHDRRRLEDDLAKSTLRNPYWMLNSSPWPMDETAGMIPPNLEYHALFQLKAHGLGASPEELRMDLDVPGCRIGDLYYIHNLTTLLEACGGTTWEG